MSVFTWDQIPVTITAEDTQTSAGAALEKEYTVGANKKWLVLGWRVTCSANKTLTVRLWKEAANTNLMEEWFTGSSGTTPLSSRGLNAASNYGWCNIEIPAGATIQFSHAADGAGQTMKTQIIYKEAPA